MKSSKGFSLVSVLSGVAILTTLVASMGVLFTSMSRQSQTIEKLKDINLSHLKMRSLLQQRSACVNTLVARYGTLAGVNPVNGDVIAGVRSEIVASPTVFAAGSEVAPDVFIDRMIVQHVGPLAGLEAVGDRYFTLEVVYRLDALITTFGAGYEVRKFIPIHMVFDNTASDPTDNPAQFNFCTTKGLSGLDIEYMNAFQDDVITTNSQYEGGVYPNTSPEFPAPAGSIVTDPPPAPIQPSGFRMSSNLQIRPVATNPDNTGFLFAEVFNAVSDRQEKTKIHTLTDPIEVIEKMSVYEYNKSNSNKTEIGLIAQDLQEHPELVRDISGTLSVNYNAVVATQIEAIKQMSEESRELKKRIQNLKKKLKEKQRKASN